MRRQSKIQVCLNCSFHQIQASSVQLRISKILKGMMRRCARPNHYHSRLEKICFANIALTSRSLNIGRPSSSLAGPSQLTKVFAHGLQATYEGLQVRDLPAS